MQEEAVEGKSVLSFKNNTWVQINPASYVETPNKDSEAADVVGLNMPPPRHEVTLYHHFSLYWSQKC